MRGLVLVLLLVVSLSAGCRNAPSGSSDKCAKWATIISELTIEISRAVTSDQDAVFDTIDRLDKVRAGLIEMGCEDALPGAPSHPNVTELEPYPHVS